MIRDLLTISRPVTCLAESAWTLVGIHLTARYALPLDIAAAVVSMALLTAAAQAFNDAQDVAVDARTRSHRPLPAGRISVRQAKLYCYACVVTAVSLAATVNVILTCYAAVIASVSLAYSKYLKRIPLIGNLTVAITASSPASYGAAATGSSNAVIWVGTAMIFWQMLGYEVLKDIRDRPEDVHSGLRSLATEWIHGQLAALIRVSLALGAAMGIWAGLLTQDSLAYYLICVPLVLVPNIGAAVIASEEKRNSLARRLIVGSWFPAIMSFWFL
ncbi:UbiA family prenyltransferase [Amycolatopsis sp. MJM2582]|uniref:UbiA family prenyltransferase n=1 Tax=Amycolatopsis sp. MJM2582 TaxID=1427749 RepID=UPI001376AABA|nr:UbiA family prenyltransferase [Amycolatopsis sp. MJM2582]